MKQREKKKGEIKNAVNSGHLWFRNCGCMVRGLGEMFEGDSADTCTGKSPLMSGGGGSRGSCQTNLL